jgi:hypothetical protein
LPPRTISPLSGGYAPDRIFHQRGFACAVLADKRMHLAAGHLEIDIVQRARAQEALGYAPRLDRK